VLGRAIAESAEHLRPWMAWVDEEPLPLDRRRARIEAWERGRARGGDVLLGERPDEPEAPAELGIEWRWRMDRASWQARPSAE
jgi:hypothetical protein